MKQFPRPVQAYILAVVVGGGLVLLSTLPSQIEIPELVLFIGLAVPGIIAGSRPLPMVYSRLKINLTGGILLMAVCLTSISLACLLAAVVAAMAGFVLRRRAWNILFMAGANVVSVALAASLYDGLADRALLPLDNWDNGAALAISASSYWLVNSALVTVLVAARNGEMVLRTYVSAWREVYVQCVLQTLLAVLGAAAWRQGVVYAILLFIPAGVVYQLLSVTRLKQEQVIRAIQIIAEVLDRRNPFTFQHSRRVAGHVARLARQLDLSASHAEVLRRAALIHDIGKVAVDDPFEEVSPGRNDLTAYNFYCLKQHAQLGAMIAREIPAFEEAEEPIRYHHDWYDGSHVSRVHSGQGIPLGARIIAVADCYDRLSMANGEVTTAHDPMAIQQLRSMSGRQLDPDLLASFFAALGGGQELAVEGRDARVERQAASAP